MRDMGGSGLPPVKIKGVPAKNGKNKNLGPLEGEPDGKVRKVAVVVESGPDVEKWSAQVKFEA